MMKSKFSVQFSADEVVLLEKITDASTQLTQNKLIIAGLEALAGSKIRMAKVMADVEKT
ncbi:hypothetical protein [Hyphomonas sp.]|uniref:hypothetical protein n=1 Tax=Hyphomonas sp. TaxID=87 RepID=UPI0025C25DEF|nr:hypothetical protein [Hyphomonas sp.]